MTEGQRRVLQVVLGINAAMFVAELGVGLVAHSTAVIADSVDMLGDAIVYGFSLYVVARGVRWQAKAALLKGGIMAAFGVGVLVEVALKIARGVVPSADLMSGVGVVALAANIFCLVLLARRKADDINMRSAWPDILMGLLIAALFGSSAVSVILGARRELRLVGSRA